jgi:hypothetical protein
MATRDEPPAARSDVDECPGLDLLIGAPSLAVIHRLMRDIWCVRRCEHDDDPETPEPE